MITATSDINLEGFCGRVCMVEHQRCDVLTVPTYFTGTSHLIHKLSLSSMSPFSLCFVALMNTILTGTRTEFGLSTCERPTTEITHTVFILGLVLSCLHNRKIAQSYNLSKSGNAKDRNVYANPEPSSTREGVETRRQTRKGKG